MTDATVATALTAILHELQRQTVALELVAAALAPPIELAPPAPVPEPAPAGCLHPVDRRRPLAGMGGRPEFACGVCHQVVAQEH